MRRTPCQTFFQQRIAYSPHPAHRRTCCDGKPCNCRCPSRNLFRDRTSRRAGLPTTPCSLGRCGKIRLRALPATSQPGTGRTCRARLKSCVERNENTCYCLEVHTSRSDSHSNRLPFERICSPGTKSKLRMLDESTCRSCRKHNAQQRTLYFLDNFRIPHRMDRPLFPPDKRCKADPRSNVFPLGNLRMNSSLPRAAPFRLRSSCNWPFHLPYTCSAGTLGSPNLRSGKSFPAHISCIPSNSRSVGSSPTRTQSR